MNLDFTRVCGKHNLIYEAYYKQVTCPTDRIRDSRVYRNVFQPPIDFYAFVPIF